MVAIDNAFGAFPPATVPRPRPLAFALCAIAAALALASVAFVIHGGDRNGARFAADMVMRFSSLAFVVFYVAGPLARLIPVRATAVLRQERLGLALAFVAIYGVFLACVAAQYFTIGAAMPLPAEAFCGLSAMILTALAISSYNNTVVERPRVAWRALESLGCGYFWLVFAVSNLDYVVGPHRPDRFHGFALCLLVLALLIRFADSFVQRHKFRLAEQAV
jgi:hypothetical protein